MDTMDTMKKRVRFNNTDYISRPSFKCNSRLSLINLDTYSKTKNSLIERVKSAKRKADENELDLRVIINTCKNAIIHSPDFNTLVVENYNIINIINIKLCGAELQYSEPITGDISIMKELEFAILMSGKRKMYIGINNLFYFDTCLTDLIRIVDPISRYYRYCFILRDNVVKIIWNKN